MGLFHDAALRVLGIRLGVPLDQIHPFHDHPFPCRKHLQHFAALAAVIARDDFDQAEQMHRKSLVIFEKLGRLEGVADNLINLGNIFQVRDVRFA